MEAGGERGIIIPQTDERPAPHPFFEIEDRFLPRTTYPKFKRALEVLIPDGKVVSPLGDDVSYRLHYHEQVLGIAREKRGKANFSLRPAESLEEIDAYYRAVRDGNFDRIKASVAVVPDQEHRWSLEEPLLWRQVLMWEKIA